jgi:hypothetical protein
MATPSTPGILTEQILLEINVITDRLRADDLQAKYKQVRQVWAVPCWAQTCPVVQEWRFAAKILNLCCLTVFTLSFVFLCFTYALVIPQWNIS